MNLLVKTQYLLLKQAENNIRTDSRSLIGGFFEVALFYNFSPKGVIFEGS